MPFRLRRLNIFQPCQTALDGAALGRPPPPEQLELLKSEVPARGSESAAAAAEERASLAPVVSLLAAEGLTGQRGAGKQGSEVKSRGRGVGSQSTNGLLALGLTHGLSRVHWIQAISGGGVRDL